MSKLLSFFGTIAVLMMLIWANIAYAVGPNAVVYAPGCDTNTLLPNDDGSTDVVALPFPLKFFGPVYNSVYVNNNGNITFDSPLSDYTPFPLIGTSRVIIAPFFGDVDTRGVGSGVATYGNSTFEGRPAFCVTWAGVGVGYYNERIDKLNSFQLFLVDRLDTNPGDFDIVFNYDQIRWLTGDASGGVDGLGGNSARVGYSNGDAQNPVSFELPGSAVNGALLDTSPTGLIYDSRNSVQLGRYIFPVRNGAPPTGGQVDGQVTDPASNPVLGACARLVRKQVDLATGAGQPTLLATTSLRGCRTMTIL